MVQRCPECGDPTYGNRCKCGWSEQKNNQPGKTRMRFYDYSRCGHVNQNSKQCQHFGSVSGTVANEATMDAVGRFRCTAHFYHKSLKPGNWPEFHKVNPFSRKNLREIKNDFGMWMGLYPEEPRFKGSDEWIWVKN
jgi:hypothetical protein